jgi:hypothetical protein
MGVDGIAGALVWTRSQILEALQDGSRINLLLASQKRMARNLRIRLHLLEKFHKLVKKN